MKNLQVIAAVCAAFIFGVFATHLVTFVLAHGGNTNFIHACVKTSNGSLRVVGASDTCGAGETALDWSQNGVGNFGGYKTNQLIGYFADGNENFGYRVFDGANFTNAGFNGNNMRSASFVSTNFTNAEWSSCCDAIDADFSNANFTGSIIDRPNLTNANFSNVNFTGAMMTYDPASGEPHTVIQNTNFTNANFTNATLTGVDFTDSTRTGVTWSNTTCPDGTNSDNNGNTCEGHLVP